MIREAQLDKIDAAQQALFDARGGRSAQQCADDPAVVAAGYALNVVVDESSSEEMSAWAARANERDFGGAER